MIMKYKILITNEIRFNLLRIICLLYTMYTTEIRKGATLMMCIKLKSLNITDTKYK